MKPRALISFFSALLSSLLLGNCVIPGIQDTISNIDNYYVYRASSAKTPHELAVYSLDGRYYMEVELRYVPIETCMFYFEVITNRTKGICVSGSDEHRVKKYLAKLSDADVFRILQREVEQPADDGPKLVEPKDFDYARAERCTVRPVKFKFHSNEAPKYGVPSEYYPYINRYEGGTLHTIMRPVAWAAWGIEIPLFVASNAIFYTTYLPYRIVEVKVFGVKD